MKWHYFIVKKNKTKQNNGSAIDQWRCGLLTACVSAKGGHNFIVLNSALKTANFAHKLSSFLLVTNKILQRLTSKCAVLCFFSSFIK